MRLRAHQRPLQLPALRGFGPGLGGPGDREKSVPYRPASSLGATNPVPATFPSKQLSGSRRPSCVVLRCGSLWLFEKHGGA